MAGFGSLPVGQLLVRFGRRGNRHKWVESRHACFSDALSRSVIPAAIAGGMRSVLWMWTKL